MENNKLVVFENNVWNELTNNEQQLSLLLKLDIIENAFYSKSNINLEEQLIEVEVISKLLNKYEKEHIKPIKDYINNYRKIVLDYEKITTKKAKELKDIIKKEIENIKTISTELDSLSDEKVLVSESKKENNIILSREELQIIKINLFSRISKDLYVKVMTILKMFIEMELE